MAISTYSVTLSTSTDGTTTWTKLVDIKDFPDLGGAPELLETTTLSDSQQTYIQGIQSLDALEFTANYTDEDYDTVASKAGKHMFYRIEFGEDGIDGTFEWEGEHSVWVSGAGVNEVVEMMIQIAPATPIKKVTV